MDIFFPYDDYFSGEEEELQKKETKLQEEETTLQEETNSQRYKVNLNRYRNFKCSREEKDDMIYVYKKYFLTKKKTKVQCVDICFEKFKERVPKKCILSFLKNNFNRKKNIFKY